MEESQRLLNPWLLHVQKLGLELKCPLCLQLFKQPVLLPCNHIFCSVCVPRAVEPVSECLACKHSYVDGDVKPAPFIENIVNIYKNIDSAFNASLACSDVGRGTTHCPATCKMEVKDKKENVEIAQEGNSSNGQSVILKRCDKLFGARKITPENIEKLRETGADGVGFIQLEQLSPQFSSDSKEDGHSSDPSSRNRNSLKRPIDKDVYGTKLESNSKHTSEANYQTTEAKRRKKTNDASNDTKMEVNGHLQTNEMASENAASVSCHSESEKPQLNLKTSPCVFCHSSKETEGTGPLQCYAQGKEVKGDVAKFSKVTYVHEKCIAWSPQIYFKDGIIQNLELEIERANKLKCSSCGKKGAALGCYMNSCKRTYHVPCAYDIPDCRWECEEYLLLCPKHESQKFPSERKSKARKQVSQKIQLNPGTTSTAVKTVVLCGSALSSDEKYSLVDFARGNGAVVSKCWRKDVTHVIAATYSTGACTRTLKVLMAILNGKWILTTEWLKACAKAGKLVDEEPYEVNLDTHGSSGGPKAGRLRVLNNDPKLFDNYKFYFSGDFVKAFKADLLNLVTTAGGAIADTKMELISSSNDANAEAKPRTVVVYNADYSDTYGFEDEASLKYQRLAAAQDVAQEFGSQIAAHTWILESIAACRILPFA